MRIILTKLLIAFAITIYNYHLPAECVYCYVCSGSWSACADPPDLAAIRWNMEPCIGDCVVYINPNTNMITRSCSTYLGIPDYGSGTYTVNGVTYTYCKSDGCNAGGAQVVQTTPTNPPTTTAAKTNPPLTTANQCPIPCLNSGSQNADCSCTCLALYSGAYCEIVNCDGQYPFCTTDFTVSDCAQEIVSLMCPKLCHPQCQAGATTTTLKPVTTTTGCNLKCQSAATLDEANCVCRCLPGTSGTLCEIVDCKQPDAPFCSVIACTDDPDFKYFCIQKCKACDSTIPPTTTTTTVKPTTTTTEIKTTTVTGCNLNCQSGSTPDLGTCTCKCLPGTSGPSCEIIDCNQPDASFCPVVGCNDDADIKYFCIQKCKTCLGTIPPTTTAGAPTTTTTVTTTTATKPTTVTTTTPTTTTTITTTTISVVTSPLCPGLSCQSGSNLNTATCKCECLTAATYGTSCEKIDCSVPDPSVCNSVSCTASASVPYLCVQKCKLCASITTTSSLLVDPCAGVTCRFGGTENIDPVTGVCGCRCLDNYYGPDCGKIKLDPNWTDPVECNDPVLDCGTLTIDEDIAGLCPLKCLYCGRKACQNGGVLKVGCTCECLSDYSGEFCEINNAQCIDSPACGTQFPAQFCDDALVKAECPKMCKTPGC